MSKFLQPPRLINNDRSLTYAMYHLRETFYSNSHAGETKKTAQGSQKVRAKENLKLSHSGSKI